MEWDLSVRAGEDVYCAGGGAALLMGMRGEGRREEKEEEGSRGGIGFVGER